MSKAREWDEKIQRVRRYMEARKAGALLLTRIPHLAWLTCGGQMHVNTATETSVATALVRGGKVAVFTSNIEAERLVREEVRGLPLTVESIPWWEDKTAPIRKAAGRGRILSDLPFPGAEPLEADFMELTWELTEAEIKRYRDLGRDVGGALQRAARAVEPGMTELEIAGLVAGGCYSTGAQPVVVLIAADRRISRFRHPIPTAKKLANTAMLVVCGRRHGLVVSCTRMVHFGKLPAALRKKHDAVAAVDAYFNTATRPGRGIADIFKGAQQVYEQTGFADEWTLHHQGGAAGYLTRSYIAGPGSKQTVRVNQAFAWNPSITGTKSEDTIIAGPGGNRVLSLGGDWPSIPVRMNGAEIMRPDILVR